MTHAAHYEFPRTENDIYWNILNEEESGQEAAGTMTGNSMDLSALDALIQEQVAEIVAFQESGVTC